MTEPAVEVRPKFDYTTIYIQNSVDARQIHGSIIAQLKHSLNYNFIFSEKKQDHICDPA